MAELLTYHVSRNIWGVAASVTPRGTSARIAADNIRRRSSIAVAQLNDALVVKPGDVVVAVA